MLEEWPFTTVLFTVVNIFTGTQPRLQMIMIVTSSIYKRKLKESIAVSCNVLWCSYESERHNRGRLSAAEHREHSCQTVSERPHVQTQTQLIAMYVFVFLPQRNKQCLWIKRSLFQNLRGCFNLKLNRQIRLFFNIYTKNKVVASHFITLGSCKT